MVPCLQVADTMLMGAEHEIIVPAPQDNGPLAPKGVCVSSEQYDMIEKFMPGYHANNFTTDMGTFGIHIANALVVFFGYLATAELTAKAKEVAAKEKECSIVQPLIA